MARKSNKSAAPAAAPIPTSTVVGTVTPRDGNTYVSKSDVKDALRTAARAAGGKWGLVSIEGKTFMLTREDGATLVAVREVGKPVVLTVPAVTPAKEEVKPVVEVAPAVEAAVEAAVAEGSTVAPAPTPRRTRKAKAAPVVEAPPVAVVVMDDAHANEVGF